jgi:hypothetical protein
MPTEGGQGHVLDPCALILAAHIDKDWRDQKEQIFYCHFECFRKVVANDSLLYIMDPDYSTHGEVEDERRAEEPGEPP